MRVILVAILTGSVGAWAGTALGAVMTPAFKLGEWTGHAMVGGEGTGCEAVILERRNRAAFSVGVVRQGAHEGRYLGLKSKALKNAEGSTVPVTIAADGRVLGTWQMEVVEIGALAVLVQTNVVPDIERAGTLTAKLPHDLFEFNVAGSGELGTKIGTCAGPPRTSTTSTGQNSQNDPVTSLVCELHSKSGSSFTKTVRFDAARQILIGEDVLGVPTFTDSSISWTEHYQSDKSTFEWELDRYAGTLTRYIARQGESTMTRLNSGNCQRVSERKF